MRNVQQRAEAPNGRCAQNEDEAQPDCTTRQISFAPALEHGYYSNQEQNDGNGAENFEQHKNVLEISLGERARAVKVRRSQRLGKRGWV